MGVGHVRRKIFVLVLKPRNTVLEIHEIHAVAQKAEQDKLPFF